MALTDLNLLKRVENSAPLSALQHDQNLTDIENAHNLLQDLFLVSHNDDGTINMDTIGVLPVNRGGTGAQVPSDARLNLGCGTIAAANYWISQYGPSGGQDGDLWFRHLAWVTATRGVSWNVEVV